MQLITPVSRALLSLMAITQLQFFDCLREPNSWSREGCLKLLCEVAQASQVRGKAELCRLEHRGV
jgi:hypothetical protein